MDNKRVKRKIFYSINLGIKFNLFISVQIYGIRYSILWFFFIYKMQMWDFLVSELYGIRWKQKREEKSKSKREEEEEEEEEEKL